MSQTVLGALRSFYSILTVTLFVPVVGALFVPRAGAPEGLASVVAGILTLLVTQFATGGAGLGPISPTFAGVIAAAGAFGVMRVMRRARGEIREVTEER
jgi:hypothetical protein